MEAIVLAGGFGTRLKTVVDSVPKSMAPVNGRPFLEYLLDFLEESGVRRVVLSVGYMHHVISDHFGDRYKSLEVDYSTEEEPLGTGGGIRLAFWKIRGERAFALNGDSIFRIGLTEMMDFHLQKKAGITIALRRVPDTSRYGNVRMNNRKMITDFAEKSGVGKTGFINGGIYIMEKMFLMEPEYRGRFSIEKDCFERIAGKSPIFGFQATGFFLDIGVPEDYHKAQHEFKAFDHRS